MGKHKEIFAALREAEAVEESEAANEAQPWQGKSGEPNDTHFFTKLNARCHAQEKRKTRKAL